MAEQPPVAPTQPARLEDALGQLTEVLRQLAELLRQQGAPPGKKAAFLDRPIVLTLIGTVFISGLTLLWQGRDQRNAADLEYQRRLHAEKHALMRTFSASMHKSGNATNRWLQYTLYIGLEKNKPRKQQSQHNIRGWSKLVLAAQGEHAAQEPVHGILTQMEATFQSDAVRKHARELMKQSAELEYLIHETNAAYNVREALTKEQVKTFDEKRRLTLQKIAQLRHEVTEAMGKELAAPPQRQHGHLFCIGSYCI